MVAAMCFSGGHSCFLRVQLAHCVGGASEARATSGNIAMAGARVVRADPKGIKLSMF